MSPARSAGMLFRASNGERELRRATTRTRLAEHDTVLRGFGMPWFPDFAAAAELARRQHRADGRADPVGLYLAALNDHDSQTLEDAWPAEVGVYDPRAGEVRGHRQLRDFIRRSRSLLAEREPRIETMATTVVPGRAVVEMVAHL